MAVVLYPSLQRRTHITRVLGGVNRCENKVVYAIGERRRSDREVRKITSIKKIESTVWDVTAGVNLQRSREGGSL